MKKKILFSLILTVLLTCLFVVGVSAAAYGESSIYYFDSSVDDLAAKTTSDAMFTSNRDANDIITSYSGAFPKTNANGEAISWYKTGQATVDGNIYVAVSSFVTIDSNYCTINASNGMYKFITANGPTKQNIVSINFPNDANIKSFSDGSGYGFYAQTGAYIPANTELLFAYFPNTWRDTNRIVQATTALEVYFDVNAPIDQINGTALTEGQMNDTAFHSCKSLRKIVFPKTLVTIKDGGNGYGCMYDCEKLEEIVFPEDIGLKYIGLYAFAYNDAITEIVLPNTVETIKDRAFEGCSSLIKLNLGASVKSLTGQSMTYISPKIQYFYVPNTITETSGSHIFTNQGGSGGLYSVVFFAGTYEEAKALNDLIGNNNNQKFYTSDYSNMIKWDSTISDEEYVQKATNDKKYYVVYGYNTCEAFYDGEHTTSGEPTCKFKGEEYLSNYVAISGCSVCGSTDSEEIVCGPLFVNKGYAKEENGSLFTYGIVVDKAQIEKYVKHTGKAFNYGVIVAAGDLVDGGTLFDESAKAIEGTITIDVTTTKYTVYQLKMTGIGDTQKDLAVYACAYVIDDTAVSYIGEETTSNAVAVSYNGIKTLIKEETTEEDETTTEVA